MTRAGTIAPHLPDASHPLVTPDMRQKVVAPPTTLLINRELALLEVVRRVLAQAEDETVPLLERLRFLCIVSSLIDEFFEIRVAGLHAELEAGADKPKVGGYTTSSLLKQLSATAHELVDHQYAVLNDVVLPKLAAEGICFLRRQDWTEAQRAWVRDHFLREIMPVLTPIGLDPAHPFPRLLNKSLNLAVQLEGRDAFGRQSGFAIVQAPRVLPRAIKLPREVAGCDHGFVFLSSVLHENMNELFAGMNVGGCYQFRVTRNSDLYVDEEEVKDLREALQSELPQRRFGDAVRLEVADTCPQGLSGFLMEQFDLDEEDLYRVNGPVNLVRLMAVPDMVDRPDLKFRPFTPGIPDSLKGDRDLFEAMRKRDVLLHHPYQSFRPVVKFIAQAARDPHVVAIKQTVYRTGTDSELMRHLIHAAQTGKEVTVVLELLARFDEEANIGWAKQLEEVGAHVVYGVVGHKTHAKLAMVVRREADGLRRYVHLGTGNYHSRTATMYTDFGLLTCNEGISADVNDIFIQLTGLGQAGELNHLWQSPFTMHRNMLAAIRREAEAAAAGRPAGIAAKMNALLEPEIIAALYEASNAGVKIDLIVRGVCALRPGVPGQSENIRVRSIIGRFLEHHRVFWFRSTGEVYLASADWMDRNFFRRIETAFPILDAKLKKRVINESIKASLADNTQAWEMGSDGRYHRRSPRRGRSFAAQTILMEQLGALAPEPELTEPLRPADAVAA
jgi:polyphosphate kinase